MTFFGGLPTGASFLRDLSTGLSRTMSDSTHSMPAGAQFDPSPQEAVSDDFYSGALNRIRNSMIGLAFAFSVVAWWKFGRGPAIGFLCGCVVAYLNFHWLKSGVSGLADRVTNTGKSQSGAGIVLRFLLRYVLLGAAAYAILTSFPASLRGLFAGLFLPVAAIVGEAVYEVYATVTRGM